MKDKLLFHHHLFSLNGDDVLCFIYRNGTTQLIFSIFSFDDIISMIVVVCLRSSVWELMKIPAECRIFKLDFEI